MNSFWNFLLISSLAPHMEALMAFSPSLGSVTGQRAGWRLQGRPTLLHSSPDTRLSIAAFQVPSYCLVVVVVVMVVEMVVVVVVVIMLEVVVALLVVVMRMIMAMKIIYLFDLIFMCIGERLYSLMSLNITGGATKLST